MPITSFYFLFRRQITSHPKGSFSSDHWDTFRPLCMLFIFIRHSLMIRTKGPVGWEVNHLQKVERSQTDWFLSALNCPECLGIYTNVRNAKP